MKHYPKIVGRPVRSLRAARPDQPRRESVATWIGVFLIGCLMWTAFFAWVL